MDLILVEICGHQHFDLSNIEAQRIYVYNYLLSVCTHVPEMDYFQTILHHKAHISCLSA